jgi:hypothetical protein
MISRLELYQVFASVESRVATTSQTFTLSQTFLFIETIFPPTFGAREIV